MNDHEEVLRIQREIEALRLEAAERTKALSEASMHRLESLEERIKLRDEYLKLRDEHLAHVGRLSSDLHGQLSSRWSVPQAMVGLLALLFSINFGYQIYRTATIEDLVRQNEELGRSLTNQAVALKEGAKQQAEVVAKLAKASGLLMSANFQRSRGPQSRDGLAGELAQQVIDLLEPEEDRLTNADVSMSNAAVAQIDLVRPLVTPIRKMLFSAYDILAYVQFRRRQFIQVDQSAEHLLQLDPESPEPHHWKGLSLHEQAGEVEAVLRELMASVQKRPRYNADTLNIAETMFVLERFGESKFYAQQYLQDDPTPPVDFEVLCRFFSEMSDFLVSDAPQKRPQEWIAYAKQRGPSLNGYSAAPLARLAERTRAGRALADVPAAKRTEVLVAIDWLSAKSLAGNTARAK